MLKKLWKKWGPNPLDRMLKKASKRGSKSVLIPWNRGMGDIALGLYATVHRIRSFIPDAQVTFLTRHDLEEPFQLLSGVDVIVDKSMKRGEKLILPQGLQFDLILENCDPSHWVAWQRGTLTPKMEWNPAWDELHLRFKLPRNCVAAHVNCETGYYFERDWPAEKWQKLFDLLDEPIVLFGLKKEPLFHHPKLFDLRGETSPLEILSIVKNRCKALIAPDSGVLGLTYFLNTSFPLKVVSLWADPNHGILKQNVQSPNPLLQHTPVISPDKKNAALIRVDDVLCGLYEHKQLLESLKRESKHDNFTPILKAETRSEKWAPLGSERLAQGKVACLILAGGQGSRLGLSIPKALVPVSPDGKKTLLEIHLEKIGHHPCALITSRENHAAIAEFLSEKKFGNNITLVIQDEAPLLDDQGNWVLKDDGKLATGPDGNGYALHLLARTGVLRDWKQAGVEEITIVPIDNPLADPVDPILIGYHAAHPANVTVKVISRENPDEKVGIMVDTESRIEVREYSEIPTITTQCLAHIGLFVMNLSFAEQLSTQEFPWHLARKTDPATKKNIWKFERFIFDMLPHSEQTNLLLYPREEVYAPLKNATGEKSLATVQAALQRILAL